MNAVRFDVLIRRVSFAISRRSVFAGLVGGDVCLRPGKRCKNRKYRCCGKGKCRNGRCRCPKHRKRCRAKCIKKAACCGDCANGERCIAGGCVANRTCGNGGPCRVFVTSQTTTGNLGGLAGADDLCQSLADASPLAGGGTYRAWLSDSTASPSTRFTNTDRTGPYELVTGETIAVDWPDLTFGSIDRRINIDELGTAISDVVDHLVLTKTEADGELWTINTTCDDWQSSSVELLTAGGDAKFRATSWSQGFLDLPCSDDYRLYCFEQG